MLVEHRECWEYRNNRIAICLLVPYREFKFVDSFALIVNGLNNRGCCTKRTLSYSSLSYSVNALFAANGIFTIEETFATSFAPMSATREQKNENAVPRRCSCIANRYAFIEFFTSSVNKVHERARETQEKIYLRMIPLLAAVIANVVYRSHSYTRRKYRRKIGR